MEDAVRRLEESGVLPGGDGKDKSEWTEVFIQGLPPDCTAVHLYQLMCTFGQIGVQGAYVVTSNIDASCTGEGFVNFLASESAGVAIHTLNGWQLPGGKVLRVERRKPKGASEGASGAEGGENAWNFLELE